jgi:rRNA maturation endonuclease Nob1
MEPQLLQVIDYSYTLYCRICNSKVIDPDKKKNQIYLDGRCPSCGNNSVVPKTKKQLKRERKAQQKALAKWLSAQAR